MTSRVRIHLSPCFALAVLALAACNMPGLTRPPVPDEPLPPPSACSHAELVAPVLDAPAESAVVDSLPTFSWSYPIYCDPDRVHVEVCIGYTCPYMVAVGDVERPESSWTPAEALPAAMHLYWRAAAVVVVDGEDVYGPWSEMQAFFTGPMCEAPSPYAPILSYPEEGAFVDPVQSLGTNLPIFQWSRRFSCLTPAHRVEISLDPSFSGEMISHTTARPVDHWRLDRELEPESTYYWRVAETDGVTLGPWSAVGTFHTNPLPVDDYAVIAGHVWHDRCFIDWEGGPPAEGCVEGDPHPVGDGVRSEGEPGIPGVTVSFVSGECTTGWDMGRSQNVHSPTAADGEYYQYLTPGTYCFTVLRSQGDNREIFDGGTWTAPMRGDMYLIYPMAEVTVEAGERRIDVDFGFDFFFGSSATPARLSGSVWSDLDADGQLDAVEPGLYAAEVTLSLGACTAAYQGVPHVTIDTAADGSYRFGYLDPGRYCLVLDPDVHPNFDLFYAGEWTAPAAGGSGLQLVDVVLAEGQVVEGMNVGWHYYADTDPTPTLGLAEPTLGVAITPQIPTPMPTFQVWLPTPQLLPTATTEFYLAPTATPDFQ